MNELARKAKQGDAKAAEEMLHRLRPLVLSSMRRYFYRREWFEDLAGRYVEVLRRSPISTRNGILHRLRLQLRLRYFYLNKRKVSTSSLDEEVVEGIFAGSWSRIRRTWLRAGGTGADEGFERALGTLTVRQRRAVVDFYLKTIAVSSRGRSGVSSDGGHTKTRALEKLRRRLKSGNFKGFCIYKEFKKKEVRRWRWY